MEVNGKPVNGIKRPADVIQIHLATPPAQRDPQTIIQKLEKHAPRESKVGGISFTLPAEVMLERQQIASVVWHDQGLAFRMRNGEILALPRVSPEVDATAFRCVYHHNRPELSRRFASHEGKLVKVVDYLSQPLWNTRLGALMAEADDALGDITWGQGGGPPAHGLAHLGGFNELALDNALFKEGKLGGRMWLAPASVRLSRLGGELTVDECRLVVRFEFWPADQEKAYYNGEIAGTRDPAAEAVAA